MQKLGLYSVWFGKIQLKMKELGIKDAKTLDGTACLRYNKTNTRETARIWKG